MKPRIAYNEQDAWDQIDELTQCINCIHFTKNDLFGVGTCVRLDREVEEWQRCECFDGRKKKINYWINKLVEMAVEYNGENDYYRQLDAMERMRIRK